PRIARPPAPPRCCPAPRRRHLARQTPLDPYSYCCELCGLRRRPDRGREGPPRGGPARCTPPRRQPARWPVRPASPPARPTRRPAADPGAHNGDPGAPGAPIPRTVILLIYHNPAPRGTAPEEDPHSNGGP